MRRTALAATLAAGLTVALGACTTAPAPSLPPPAPSSGPASASAGPTPSPAPASAPSATPSEPPSFVPSEPPPVPTAPAPSTAGGLGEDDVARPNGWSPTARPGSPEEGYLGNGTWVHAVSAEHSAFAAISLGCTELRAYPTPTAALEGTLAGPTGQAGIGVTLEFADASQAAAYFSEWTRQAEACLGTGTERVSQEPTLWLGRRHLGTVWSEAVGLRDNRVVLLIVDDPAADLAGAIPPTDPPPVG